MSHRPSPNILAEEMKIADNNLNAENPIAAATQAADPSPFKRADTDFDRAEDEEEKKGVAQTTFRPSQDEGGKKVEEEKKAEPAKVIEEKKTEPVIATAPVVASTAEVKKPETQATATAE